MLNAKENREIWMKKATECKELLDGEIKNDIEKYRKGWCKLRVVDASGNPLKNTEVKVEQTKHDFKYGANIFMLDEFGDEAMNKKYREAFKKYFNAATVPFYWDGLEPTEGKPRFAKDSEKVYRRPSPELCVEYCEENGISPKLHCLVYDKFIPEWLPRDDMKKMEALYEKRISEIAERFSGRLFEFEVINELLCEGGWNFKSVISDKKDIIEWSFDLARKYLPYETLVINECNTIESLCKHDFRAPYYMMVENALMKGAEIDKIGLQHHCFTGADATSAEQYEAMVKRGTTMFNPATLRKGLQTMANLGLPMELTEITVPTFGETAEDEELQADLLDVLYTSCFSVPEVDTLVYWNAPDGYAYNAAGRNWNENQVKGGLFRHDMTPKKSAERLYEMFNKRWHTSLTLTTDDNGYVEFRGFYGDYELTADGIVEDFGIHKSEDNTYEMMI